jgi:hypothetical protein
MAIARLWMEPRPPVKRIIAENDLVFGVWPDLAEPDGIGVHIIKGKRRLRSIASGADPTPGGTVRLKRAAEKMRVSAVPCDCAEQAIAAQQTLGEPDDEEAK